MNAAPRISVVTPSLDQGRYLEAAMRSVLEQDYPEIEYIVIDGGSRDGSAELIERYADRLAYAVSEPDRGQAHALNKGFARASGELLCFLNSDDLLVPGALRAAAAAYRAGAPWLVGTVRYLRDDESWPVPQPPYARLSDWFAACPICQPGCFFAAELRARAGPFREDLALAFDYEMWMRLRVAHREQPRFISAPMALYRLHEQSKTVARNAEFRREMRLVWAEYEPALDAAERLSLWAARRHRRGRWHARAAIDALRAGDVASGALAVGRALASWPLLPLDRRLPLGLRALVGGGDTREGHEPPEVWPSVLDD